VPVARSVGGEAQLLAMARVWLRDPDLLVLDEATARIDPATEAKVESAIRTLIEGRTTIVIAHRLSTLREVDEIVVFDAGRSSSTVRAPSSPPTRGAGSTGC
jgi:ABC-type multidrug transport system fused ATPase/permease subunit